MSEGNPTRKDHTPSHSQSAGQHAASILNAWRVPWTIFLNLSCSPGPYRGGSCLASLGGSHGEPCSQQHRYKQSLSCRIGNLQRQEKIWFVLQHTLLPELGVSFTPQTPWFLFPTSWDREKPQVIKHEENPLTALPIFWGAGTCSKAPLSGSKRLRLLLGSLQAAYENLFLLKPLAWESSSQHSRELPGWARSLRDVSNWIGPVYRL